MLQLPTALLAQGGFERILNIVASLPWFAWPSILGVLGWAVITMMRMSQRHREHMEMIRHGIDPRSPRYK